MAHKIELKVTVTLERESGKFASRLDMIEALIELVEGQLDGEQLLGIGVDADSNYYITGAYVEEM